MRGRCGYLLLPAHQPPPSTDARKTKYLRCQPPPVFNHNQYSRSIANDNNTNSTARKHTRDLPGQGRSNAQQQNAKEVSSLLRTLLEALLPHCREQVLGPAFSKQPVLAFPQGPRAF